MTDTTAQQGTAQKGAIHLDEQSFAQTTQAATTPIMVDFYAEWCGPCKLAAPIIDKLADELRGRAIIAKVNVDDARMVAQQYGVMSIPTVVMLQNKDGKVVEVDRKIGFGGEDGYRQMLAKALADDSVLKRAA